MRGTGRRRTQHGHHEVLAGLGLAVLCHARVGASLGGLQATQLEAAPPGDHAMRHAALCGTEGRARPSPARPHRPRRHHGAPTRKSRDPWRRRPSPTLAGPQEPWHRPPASGAHRETEAQTGAGSFAAYITTFLSWVSKGPVPHPQLSLLAFLAKVPHFLPVPRPGPLPVDPQGPPPLPPPTPSLPCPLSPTRASNQGKSATH